MTKNYLYISGPISNDPDYLTKFINCERWILKNTKCIPINPAVASPVLLKKQGIDNPNQDDYMRMSINLLTLNPNTGIVMLEDWELSEGAKIENQVAINLNYNIYYFDQNVPELFSWYTIPKEMFK